MVLVPRAFPQTQSASASAASIVKAVGTIKTVAADSITVAAESGGDVTAKLAASTKILRVPPGEKDLKNATPLQLQDLQPGDRVLLRGTAAPDAHTIAALAVIVMKQGDISAKQQRERDDWQKHGVGGLVSKVDSAAGIITISSGGFTANRTITVHVSKDTVLRRYAPTSVKFDDAKPAPLDQIKAGDQLRARGTRSADGSELAADEIVSGTFRNIAGPIVAIDASNNSITVNDLIHKSNVVVKISTDSQMKKLPAEMAQRIAARFRAGAAGSAAGTAPKASAQVSATTGTDSHSTDSHSADSHITDSHSNDAHSTDSQAPAASGQGAASTDFQRLLSRLPNSTLADMQKGEAVMLVSTEGSGSDPVTAITLLAGVDPILAAAPGRSYSLLSPWSLNSSGGEGEAAQ
jgi:hypothetical protein